MGRSISFNLLPRGRGGFSSFKPLPQELPPSQAEEGPASHIHAHATYGTVCGVRAGRYKHTQISESIERDTEAQMQV